MPQENMCPQSYDRFNSVESVATQIFQTMPGLDQSGPQPDEADTDPSQQDASNVVPLFERAENDTGPLPTHSERLWDALVFAFQERNLAALVALSQHAHTGTEADTPVPAVTSTADISFREARRRAHLPEGIELLKGKPSIRTDDETLQSIRALVEEQEREQQAVELERMREQQTIELEKKRELSRQILAPLETPASDATATAHPFGAAFKPTAAYRVRLWLKKVFINDIFLASGLSIWTTLALMVFIDPALSTALFAISAFFLFVASCLFTSERAMQATI